MQRITNIQKINKNSPVTGKDRGLLARRVVSISPWIPPQLGQDIIIICWLFTARDRLKLPLDWEIQ